MFQSIKYRISPENFSGFRVGGLAVPHPSALGPHAARVYGHDRGDRTRRNDIFNTVTSIVYFVFLFASNMFYPLEPLPKWFRAAALANPITWQIDCLRWATIGFGSTHRVALEATAFIPFAVACFLYAARCLQRQQ